MGAGEDTPFRSRGTREEVTDSLAFVALKFQNVACAVAAMRVMERVYEDLQEVVVNRNTCYTAATLRDAGKGEALTRLSSELRIEPPQVITIGDSYNHLSMLDGRFGFRSAAITNAEDIIKQAVQRNGGHISQNAGAAGFSQMMELLLDDRLG